MKKADIVITLKDVPESDVAKVWATMLDSCLRDKGLVLSRSNNIVLDYPKLSDRSPEATSSILGSAIGLYAVSEAIKHNRD